MTIKNFYLFIILISWLIFHFFACIENNGISKKENEQILAKIGSHVITVDEFRKNYEFGFSNLKSGKNRKKTYLEHMIKEKLLSIEGYKQGLDKSESVNKSVESLKRELLIEQLIKIKVKDKIKVTSEEIKEYINKSKVQFKFRYWVESNLEKAKSVTIAMREHGYAAVLEELLLNNPELSIDPRHYETDYLNHEQVSPDILLAIKDLPYGEISEPVELKNRFYIFQVLDIRRNAVTKNEYMSRASSVEQVIFYQKFEKALVEYGTNLLDNKSIKTKRSAFNLLADAIIEWQDMDKKDRMNFEYYLSESNNDLPNLKELAENASEPFLIYDKGSVSIEEIIKHINTSKFLKKFNSKNKYLNYLHNTIERTIRDMFLVREAELLNLEENLSLQKNILLWKNKWVYEQMRNSIAKDLSTEKNDQLKIITLLENRINDLKNDHKIEINESILDTITVIDFKKSKWASMQILRSGTNKPAYPVADPRLDLINY